MAPARKSRYLWAMKTIEMMLRSHPRLDVQRAVDYAEALKALSTCSEVCTSCADACLGEPEHLEQLRRCIRTTLDCADVCASTARILIRQTETPNELVHAQLHACTIACQVCADECDRHGEMHDHCRLCADTCRYCQERCNFLLGELSSAGVAEGGAEPANPNESPALSR
jgi:hypothetical protein